MEKKLKITDSMQKVAVDILEELEVYMMTNSDSDKRIFEIYNKFFKKYDLCNDPFTSMVCSTKEYFKNLEEYNRQLMYEKYGYYE